MARKETSVAPKERINVTFKPATGGAVEEIELPMKVMVLGDFQQRQDPRAPSERKPVSINKNNFAEVMEKQELHLDLAIPDVLRDGGEGNDLSLSLDIRSMRDFEPGNILEQIPETNKLLRIREALLALRGPMGNMPAFRAALDEVLKDPEQREEIKRELMQAGIELPGTAATKAPYKKGKHPKPAEQESAESQG
jgi:type VI secretion system protein ImpB